MSYLTETGTNNRKMTALGIAVLVHVFIIYALITGLASDAVKHIQKTLETTDIKEEKPPEEPPPPPPEKLQDIPVVTPPPDVVVQTSAAPVATITTNTTVAMPVAPQPVYQAPPAPVAAPAPPPKPLGPAVRATERGNNRATITNEDYPDASLRAEEEGTTRVTYEINEKGRVENCAVTQSSGHPRLDETTCALITRRFKFTPAKAEGGQPVRETGHADAIKWVVPKDR